jgi:hypothetical protein
MQHDAQRHLNRQQDFAAYVVGTIRIPNRSEWHLKGFMASQSYLFPKEEMDDTYRQLQSKNVADLAAEIESEEGVPNGALGRAALYTEPASTTAV